MYCVEVTKPSATINTCRVEMLAVKGKWAFQVVEVIVTVGEGSLLGWIVRRMRLWPVK